jgi:mRNA interferase ChpB
MSKAKIPQRGDIYKINPNPTSGREMSGWHRFVVITPKDINALGVAITVPITGGGNFARNMGLTVPITGYETNGVAVCNQVRSFDLKEREKNGTARYIETIEVEIVEEIINRVISVIDPV